MKNNYKTTASNTNNVKVVFTTSNQRPVATSMRPNSKDVEVYVNPVYLN